MSSPMLAVLNEVVRSTTSYSVAGDAEVTGTGQDEGGAFHRVLLARDGFGR
jgi:hypothetical protein